MVDRDTPPKANMSRGQKWWLEDETSFWNGPFLGESKGTPPPYATPPNK